MSDLLDSHLAICLMWGTSKQQKKHLEKYNNFDKVYKSIN